jgi:tetratricopeptide (TPR) repeat protein
MGKRDLIRILVILVALMWMSVLVMPRRYALVDDLNARYYDKAMASQEFMLRKQLKALTEDKSASQETKLDVDETLAKNFWAIFKAKDAASMLRDIQTERDRLNRKYNQKTINTMLTLAAVYRDLNQLNDAGALYDKIWELDKANLSATDSRLMRDQTNFALFDYLCGDVETDAARRQQLFKESITHTKQAMQIWHKQADPDTAALANLFYLQYVGYRDLGDYPASRQAFGEMKYLNRQLKREYNPPWK